MFKTSDRASFLIIFFRLLQYFVFVVLNGDVFLPFFIGNFIATPSPEKKIAYKTFLHSKTIWELLGVCYVWDCLSTHNMSSVKNKKKKKKKKVNLLHH